MQENWLLVTADYSQIELRLMAHFSKDSSLVDLLTKPLGDVFNLITAKWTGKSESSVDPKERDQTKRLVYGILYGMGANSLAEQLECSPEDAGDKIQSFKRSFPGLASWLKEAVTVCRKKGWDNVLPICCRYNLNEARTRNVIMMRIFNSNLQNPLWLMIIWSLICNSFNLGICCGLVRFISNTVQSPWKALRLSGLSLCCLNSCFSFYFL